MKFWILELLSAVLLYVAIVVGPIFPIWLAIVISLALLIYGLASKGAFNGQEMLQALRDSGYSPSSIPVYLLEQLEFRDIALGVVFYAVAVIAALGTMMFAVTKVSLFTLIMAGVAADAVSVLGGMVESAGYLAGIVPGVVISALEGLLCFFIVSIIVGGLLGALLGGLAGVIAMIPGPIPLNTVSFVGLKMLLGGR